MYVDTYNNPMEKKHFILKARNKYKDQTWDLYNFILVSAS